MLKTDFTPSFARDRKRCAKKHWDISTLDAALAAVAFSDEEPIAPEFGDHALAGDLHGCRALHIGGKTSNWVLLYEVCGDSAYFIATGTRDEVYAH